MKRSGAISLLALLFYTQLGYYGQFVLLQWQLKEAAREAWIAALPDNSLVPIRLSDVNAKGKWEEAGRECWYGDHLYDVVRQKTIAGTAWLFCLDDEREERLIRQSGEMTRANHDHPDKKTGHSFSLRTDDLLCESAVLRVTFFTPRKKFNNDPPNNPLPTCYTEIAIPPPKG